MCVPPRLINWWTFLQPALDRWCQLFWLDVTEFDWWLMVSTVWNTIAIQNLKDWMNIWIAVIVEPFWLCILRNCLNMVVVGYHTLSRLINNSGHGMWPYPKTFRSIEFDSDLWEDFHFNIHIRWTTVNYTCQKYADPHTWIYQIAVACVGSCISLVPGSSSLVGVCIGVASRHHTCLPKKCFTLCTIQ